MVSPYLSIHYFETNEEISSIKLTEEEAADADVMQGYIQVTDELKIKQGYERIREIYINEMHLTEEEADAIINDLKATCTTISEIENKLTDYWITNGSSYFLNIDCYQGNKDEVNTYISDKLNEHDFSYYFSRKFVDAAGLYIGFFSAILLAFLFIRDTKKDTYELLHTKPISPLEYIGGKILGGFLAMIICLIILTLIFGSLSAACALNSGFEFNFIDLVVADVLYIAPNLLMITCIYAAIAFLFKNPIPAVPMIFIYMAYSNMGSRNAEGVFGYYGRPLAIMVRFPGTFFDTAPPPMVLLNQLFLVFASIILLIITVFLWKRRRTF